MEWPGPAEEAAKLEVELAAIRLRRRRARRFAKLVYLLSGLALGTAVYLARTRFARLVAGHKLWLFLIVVGVFVGLFVLAARVERDAAGLEERARDLEERLVRVRRAGRGVL